MCSVDKLIMTPCALVLMMQILSSYKEEGFSFLLKVFNNSDYLEQVTGLHSLYSAADRADVRTAQRGGGGGGGELWLVAGSCSLLCTVHAMHTYKGELFNCITAPGHGLPAPAQIWALDDDEEF